MSLFSQEDMRAAISGSRDNNQESQYSRGDVIVQNSEQERDLSVTTSNTGSQITQALNSEQGQMALSVAVDGATALVRKFGVARSLFLVGTALSTAGAIATLTQRSGPSDRKR
jgi:hypothetical protein